MDARREDHPTPDVEVHPTAVVEEGAQMGAGTRVWHFVHVRSRARIGDVFVGPAAVFTNDRFPLAARGDWKLLRTLVRRGASIGANATILPGVTIGGWAVAAGGVVTKDVAPHRLVVR